MRKFLKYDTGSCFDGIRGEGVSRGDVVGERTQADGYLEKFLREDKGINTEKAPKAERFQKYIPFYTEGSLSRDFFSSFLKMNVGARDMSLTNSPSGYTQTKYSVDSRGLVEFIKKYSSKISVLVYKTGLEFGVTLGSVITWWFVHESGHVWIKKGIATDKAYRDAAEFFMGQGVLKKTSVECHEGVLSFSEISGRVSHIDIKIPIKNMSAYRQLESSVKAKSLKPVQVGNNTVADWQFKNGCIHGFVGKRFPAEFIVSVDPSEKQFLRVEIYSNFSSVLGEAADSVRKMFSLLGVTQ